MQASASRQLLPTTTASLSYFADEGINVMPGWRLAGHDDSGATALPVTVGDIAYHTRAVRRSAPTVQLSDLPFMAYAPPGTGVTRIVMRAGPIWSKLKAALAG